MCDHGQAAQAEQVGAAIRVRVEAVAHLSRRGTDQETADTADLLRDIARTQAVIVVEHDMTFVRELGVKVTCLHEGSVLAEGTIDQVSQNDRVVEVYLGR